MRYGIGFQIYPRETGKKFHLGGIEIPAGYGLRGPGEADVLIHSLCDALSGALALGSMNALFLKNREDLEGISFPTLLKQTYELIRQEGYELHNLDAVIVLEQPNIQPYLKKIRQNIADIFWCDINQISVKATITAGIDSLSQPGCVTALTIVSLRKRKGK
ncbi:MAG: 2-C-methyl-D-erythritol 2,4-cyclodiphosphate synthase [Calditrichia bacterium]